MKKRSNREAYEKRKGRNNNQINAARISEAVPQRESVSEAVSEETAVKEVVASETPARETFEARERVNSQSGRAIPERKGVTVEVLHPKTSGPRRPVEKQHRRKGGRFMLLSGVIVIAVVLLFAALYAQFGNKDPFHVAFTFNSATVITNDDVITMEHSMYQEKDTAVAPLAGLSEVLPIYVKWDGKSDDVTVKGNGVKLKLTIDETAVEINGETENWPEAPLLKQGVLYVPLVAFCQAFGYETSYTASIARVDVFEPGGKNEAPTVTFTTDKDSYAVGETVIYKVDAQDADGDEIVDYQWTNHQEKFENAGEVTISLKVKDSRGLESEEVSKVITIVAAAESSEGEE